MTIVASFMIHNTACMIGDLLISVPMGSDQQDASYALPIRTMRRGDIQGSRLPSGLSQKLVIVHDRMVIGWSGCYAAASEVIPIIKKAMSGVEIPKEYDLDRVTAILPGRYVDKLRLIYLAAGENGKLLQGGYGNVQPPLNSGAIKRIMCSGSGSAAFYSECDSIERDDVQSSLDVQQNVMRLVGKMYSLEVRGDGGIGDGFGGCYEIVTYDGERFSKEDSILYATFIWESDGEMFSHSWPISLVKMQYVDSTLFLMCLNGDDSASCYGLAVGSPGSPPSLERAPAENYSAETMCLTHHFYRGGEYVGTIEEVRFAGSEDSFSISIEDGRHIFEIDTKWRNGLALRARDRFLKKDRRA